MLASRLTPSRWVRIDQITFAFFGLCENAIGLLRMFSIKKQTIKIEKFSRDRQKQLLLQQKTESNKKEAFLPTLADQNRESRNEYNVPTQAYTKVIEDSEIREESYHGDDSNRGAEELKVESSR